MEDRESHKQCECMRNRESELGDRKSLGDPIISPEATVISGTLSTEF